MIRLLVGLGNPGAEYEGTRHNAGFWWVEAAARKLGAALQPQRQWYGLAARAATAHGPVWLLLPMTYMNLSGKAVAALARFYKIAPEEILVVHDELDLPPGEAKIKQGGGTAGHNGLKDIHAQLGSAAFWRLRLGIGHPGVRAEVVDYVLRRPAPDQREAIEQTVARTLGALDALLAGDMAAATQQIHTRKPPRPKPPRPAPAAQPPAGTAGGLGGDTEPTP
ncbi:MAG TPA: aminoacyl-tRNA hydrolase [Rubrivivax sp.]|nr:aminoacyl-tRNA hydrolase [Rubrivivax sp.]HRY88976.1 aminoacyl-tRNA hydrolase [Rubrivivax sp.]HRZ60172.1 aminoacyl-tRNA hydrolase [Rubrivivax sp.]